MSLTTPPSFQSRGLRSRLGVLTAVMAVASLLHGPGQSGRAEESGNRRLMIHTYHDEETSGLVRLGFEMEGEAFGFEELEKRLRPLAAENAVLALVAAAPLSTSSLKRVVETVEAAGIRYLVLEARPTGNSGAHGDPVAGSSRALPAVEKRLNAITLPSVEFVRTPLKDALDFLRYRAQELDESTGDPNARGVNLVLKGDADFRQTPVTLDLSEVPVSEVLLFVAQLVNAEIRVDENALVFQPRSGEEMSGKRLGDDPEARAETERKLRSIVIPLIEFAETPLPDALAYLRARSEALDESAGDSPGRGVNLVLAMDPDPEAAPPRISLNLKNVTLGDALRYTSELAGLGLRIHGGAVVIEAKPVAPPREQP